MKLLLLYSFCLFITSGQCLSIALVNVALGKPANMTGYNTEMASLAVDGDRSSGNCALASLTASGEGPALWIELQSSFFINEIKFTILNTYWPESVMVGNTSNFEEMQLCNDITISDTPNDDGSRNASTTCSVSGHIRYLSVHTSMDTLAICELEVFGYEDICHLNKTDERPPGQQCGPETIKYYYNYQERRCETYSATQCGDNNNSFDSFDSCQLLCETFGPVDVCSLRYERGPCDNDVTRYYHDKEMGCCLPFQYGGCDGNGNNFPTKNECRSRCMTGGGDPCGQPKKAGPCEAYIRRYYYNQATQQCEMFGYGGCCPNDNNFETAEECQQLCTAEPPGGICSLPKDIGSCNGFEPRYYYNAGTNKCEPLKYSGCGGNKNNFKTLAECNAQCSEDVCSLPPESGMCTAAFLRYYYDIQSGQCKPFTWGGCGTNGNNFETEQECYISCSDIDVCLQSYRPGSCTATTRRYFYNAQTQQCEPIESGMCHGDKNNFGSIEACIDVCAPQVGGDPCFLPVDPGPCRGSFQKYYYNTGSGSCDPFIYGGCKGNSNNFMTMQECEAQCRKPVTPFPPVGGDPCFLPPDPGRCKARLPRYFYNYGSRQCEFFYYGGCEGNNNNFLTLDQCEGRCADTAAPASSNPTMGVIIALIAVFAVALVGVLICIVWVARRRGYMKRSQPKHASVIYYIPGK